MPVNMKRAYDAPAKEDGVRVLVDRIWPRGVFKENLEIDHWMKDIAPTAELRKWFNHEPAKFDEFKKRYKQELKQNGNHLEELKQLVIKNKKHVTLVYGAKDEKHNQAVVLKEILDRQRI